MKTTRTTKKIFIHFFLLFGAICMLLPFLWMLSTSFKTEAEAFIFPPEVFGKTLVWQNYLRISDRFNYFLYMLNSIKVSAWVVFFQLLTSSMAGYVFARLHFKGRDKLFLIYLCTMMVPVQVTVITNFITMMKIGLVNTHFSLMIPPMVSAFGTFLMRQFFSTLPSSLDDAARIDGCNPFMIFFRILLPLAGSALATLGIFCFMGIWNDYFTPLIYITNSLKYTLPLGLATMKGMYATNWPVLMAASSISILPVLIAFLFAQDAFVKGIALTGLKN
ncbi:MAG: carbohydrate ABC transporter permease [Peptostreptococcaceae bacterium]|nr:carbohydrate ABC transporter permease [Peptostreptococcaceae bacterium]